MATIMMSQLRGCWREKRRWRCGLFLFTFAFIWTLHSDSAGPKPEQGGR